MTYVDVLWHHDFAGEPTRLVSELDDERYETRKLEFFADGRVDFADGTRSRRTTRLREGSVPPIEEISADPQVTARQIVASEFEELWSRFATGHGSPAFRDDVLPTAHKHDVPLERWMGDRTSLEVECLHLYISDPKRDRAFWVQQFPRLTRLKYLEIKSRPNQEVFEAICRVPNLERLDVVWSNITDLEPIESLRKLTHFKLGSSPRVRTLGPLAKMTNLVSLGVWSVRQCSDLSPIGALTQLRGLELVGGEYTTQVFDTLNPLSALKDLEYFSLRAVRTVDRSLAAVAHFRKLKYLELTALQYWPAIEYERLFDALFDVPCEPLRLAATDVQFRKKHGIRN